MALPIEKLDRSLLGRLKSRLLGLSLNEASFSRRGFPGQGSSSREHLESVIHAFIEGYNLAVGTPHLFQLAGRLDASFPSSFVGFAYEGAGLYFGLADLMVPRSESRLKAFTSSAGKQHDYIATVGAGFAVARTPLGLRRLESYQGILDPMNAWCVADGYGFHEGFFHWKRFVDGRREAPGSLTLQNRRLFDAGVGRAMWWVYGADPASIATAISRFDGGRQPEMWAGIGTALAYAGGGRPGATSLLSELAGELRYDLLSGIPFAAHMRHRGGNPAEWTDEVCSDLLDLSVEETSDMIVAELETYLDSWEGTEQEKWSGCYVALRDRVKQRIENVHAKPFDTFACAEGRS